MTRAEKIAETKRKNAESATRIKKAQEEMRAHVARGTCPSCNAPLRRNLSLAGWWQCAQLGSEQFRLEPSKPSCSFQGFTE
jgi:ribosomal protein L37AE/L43A